MHESDGKTLFTEAFERVVHGLPHQPEFNGVEIVQTIARPGRNDTALSVMIDREGGVDIGTCERVAARINVSLDAFNDPYTLEVTSAGVNRPLFAEADYDRFAGRAAKIVTTAPIAGAKTHRGLLGGMRGGNVILTTGAGAGVEVPIPFAGIKTANLEYDIRADLQRAKKEKNGKQQ